MGGKLRRQFFFSFHGAPNEAGCHEGNRIERHKWSSFLSLLESGDEDIKIDIVELLSGKL